MLDKQTINKINDYGQSHLLKFYDEINNDERNKFEEQINQLDFTLLDLVKDRAGMNEKKVKPHYEPLEALRKEEIANNKENYYKIGIEALKQCRVGAVLLAGGQGTRLGFDKPKGMFNIGVNRRLYIFERLIQNLQEVVDQIGCYVPLFIMTSEKNDADTRNFFKENDYFGYDKKYIYFFVQDMAPSVDYNNKFLLEDKFKLSLSPNGNGGWFASMVTSGLLDKIKRMNIEWLNVFSVDNVLQKIVDPVFVGATIESGYPAGAKVVKKANPNERVGVMCRENGKPSIVEYYELTEEMINAKDSYGEPAYNYGVILNYLFRVKDLVHINNHKLVNHIVEKKIPYINEQGEYIKPEVPNGFKFEKLILDMINLLDDCLVFEVERNKEFAPVKNKEGNDSIETARALLKENGIEI